MTEEEIRNHLKNNPIVMPTNEAIKSAMASTIEDAMAIIRRYTGMVASKTTLVNIVKLQAIIDKAYFDALMGEGFTREEALRLVESSDSVFSVE
jgi:hypothetical protein